MPRSKAFAFFLSNRTARRTVDRIAAICMVAVLWAAIAFSICANSSSIAFSQDDGTIKPGMYWTLSSKWRWNAYGTGDHAGWRVEREDWNDTLSIQEVSGSMLRLGLKRVGHGALEASGSFIIGGRQTDSWTIDKQYSIMINATNYMGSDGKPVRWVVNVKGLNASGSVSQMWTDENYRYVQVRFPVAGSEPVKAGAPTRDTWVVSYRSLTTGYWSASGNHSTGLKQETLNYDKTYGFLLQATYNGTYTMQTHEGGWNETEVASASTIDSNLEMFAGARNTDLLSVTVFAAAVVVIGVITFAVLLHRHRKAVHADR